MYLTHLTFYHEWFRCCYGYCYYPFRKIGYKACDRLYKNEEKG